MKNKNGIQDGMDCVAILTAMGKTAHKTRITRSGSNIVPNVKSLWQ